MRLVKVRPIPLPVFKGGKWRDDYAVTGGVDPGYSATGCTRVAIAGGMRLNSTLTTMAYLLPSWYRAANFEAEVMARRIAGATTFALQFRYLDATHRWYVALDSTNDRLSLSKRDGGNTIVATLNNVSTTSYRRISVKAIGPSIQVFLDGVRVFSTTDAANLSYTRLGLGGYDAVAGTAQADWQYLAIDPR